mgnify:CR=1 FL=1
MADPVAGNSTFVFCKKCQHFETSNPHVSTSRLAREILLGGFGESGSGTFHYIERIDQIGFSTKPTPYEHQCSER